MTETIYNFLNRTLKSFSYEATLTNGNTAYSFDVTIDGSETAYIGELQRAKRITVFSVLENDLPDEIKNAFPSQFADFPLAVNCGGFIRKYKICKDFDGIRFKNDRFNVPTGRIRFYGVKI